MLTSGLGNLPNGWGSNLVIWFLGVSLGALITSILRRYIPSSDVYTQNPYVVHKQDNFYSDEFCSHSAVTSYNEHHC